MLQAAIASDTSIAPQDNQTSIEQLILIYYYNSLGLFEIFIKLQTYLNKVTASAKSGCLSQ
jgi:hypothetical protein